MTDLNALWNCEDTMISFDISVPAWIDQDITPCDVASIVQGGCESGAYMPAVTYHEAAATMAKHGDDVLNYIHDIYGELPQPKATESWSGLACFYLSTAVETWALGAADMLSEKLAA